MSPELPFVVEWGHVIGVGLALLFAVGFAGCGWWLARRRALTAAARQTPRAENGQLGETPGEPRYYTGELVGGATITSFDGGNAAVSTADLGPDEAAVTRADSELALQIGDQRVPLEGPVRCALGSREWAPGRQVISLPDALAMPLQQDAEAAGRGSVLGCRPRISSLCAGDAVRVFGVLERRAAPDGEGAYREISEAFALLAPTSMPAEELVLVFAGRPSVTVQSRGRRLGMAVLGFALAYGALYTQAEWVAGDASQVLSRAAADANPAEHPVALRLALSPQHRSRMIYSVWRAMSQVAPADAEFAERRVRMATELGCMRAVETAVEHGLVERARELTRECPEARHRGAAACEAGRYDELPVGWPNETHQVERYAVVTQLAARRFAAAGGTVRALVASAEQASEPAFDMSSADAIAASLTERIHQAERDESRAAQMRNLRCVASLADDMAGVASGRPELAASAESSSFCRLLLASITEGPERLALLASLDASPEAAAVLSLTTEVSVSAAAARLVRSPPRRGLRPGRHLPSPLAFPRLDGALAAITDADALPSDPRTLALRSVLRFMEAARFVSRADPERALAALEVSEGLLRRAEAQLRPARPPETGTEASTDAPVVAEDAEGLVSYLDALRGWIELRRALLAIEAGDAEEARLRIASSPSSARGWASERLSMREAPLDLAEKGNPSLYFQGLVDAAADGDGRAIARAMGREFLVSDELLRLTFATDRHQDVLATHLRYRQQGIFGRCQPSRTIQNVVGALRLARLLGDDSWVEALEARRDRLLGALDHPDVALPIVLVASFADVDES